MDLSPYVAKYVQTVIHDEQKKLKMFSTLANNEPFIEPDDMAVAILDIAGYSAMTSFFVEILGKFSSEAISDAVGAYIEQISTVVLRHGGDIVKFLGDAVLVTFSSHSDSSTDLGDALRRALNCCFEILVEHGSFKVDLQRWEVMARKDNLYGLRRTDSAGFDKLGCAERKEAGLLGDVFNLAARLLYIERDSEVVAIDERTMAMAREEFNCIELGKHKATTLNRPRKHSEA
ncbi:hypothetical protein HDU96_007677 [Phlyctochytrium bullatum]|nr:hypothetical protein HDU96_007677 [Phlyctochytrium bullatum]